MVFMKQFENKDPFPYLKTKKHAHLNSYLLPVAFIFT